MSAFFTWCGLLWRSPLSRVGLSCCASSQVKEPTCLDPSGFNPRRQAGSHASGLRPARSACLLPRCAGERRVQVATSSPQPTAQPGLCDQGAFAAYPRSQAPCGIPRPLDRAALYGRPGLPRPPEPVWHHLQQMPALQERKKKQPFRLRLKAFIDHAQP